MSKIVWKLVENSPQELFSLTFLSNIIMITAMRHGLRWLFFNLKYFGRPPWDTGIPPPELLAFLQQHPPGRALDLGCGTGTNLLAMLAAGWEVCGVDYALRAVLAARRHLRQAGYAKRWRVLAGDVTGPMGGVKGPFDLVLDIGCYHGIVLPDRPAYRRNLLNWLAPGGHFLLYAHLADVQGQGGFGFYPEDQWDLAQDLTLLGREDSLDSRGRRASWQKWWKQP